MQGRQEILQLSKIWVPIPGLPNTGFITLDKSWNFLELHILIPNLGGGVIFAFRERYEDSDKRHKLPSTGLGM